MVKAGVSFIKRLVGMGHSCQDQYGSQDQDLCPSSSVQTPPLLHVRVDRRSFLSFEVIMSGTCNKRRRGLLLQRCTGSDRGSVEKTLFDVVTFEDLTPVSCSQCLEPCKESWDLKENQCQDLCEVCHYHKWSGGLRRRCERFHVAIQDTHHSISPQISDKYKETKSHPLLI